MIYPMLLGLLRKEVTVSETLHCVHWNSLLKIINAYRSLLWLFQIVIRFTPELGHADCISDTNK